MGKILKKLKKNLPGALATPVCLFDFTFLLFDFNIFILFLKIN
jgi:hypothetical protein